MQAIRILGGERDSLTGLAAYDGDDLFRLGFVAYKEARYPRSTALFERFLEEFPEHPDGTAASWNLALGLERLGRGRDAAVSFQNYAARVHDEDPGEAARAWLRAAILLQVLGDYEASRTSVERASSYEALDLHETWEVRGLAAMVLAADGDMDRAERELDRVRREIRRVSLQQGERYPYQSAMLWYQAGQFYRMRAARVSLDRVDDVTQLGSDVAEKASLLLEARQHLRRSLQHRIGAWSGPAALAFGAVFEDFRDDLLAAPRPTDMDAEVQEVYDSMLEERSRQFLERAAVDYREVLRLGEVLRLEDAWIGAIEEALSRCEQGLALGIRAEHHPRDPPLQPGGG